MKALVIGFGNVGQKIAEIVIEKRKYPALAALDLCITGIYTKTRGALTDPSGIDLPNAIQQIRDEGHFSNHNPQQTDHPLMRAIQHLDYDLLLELSTLSIADKGEPAISYIKQALKRGKHVVTANKGPVAFAYHDLMKLARKLHVQFLHESTVMDGTPVFNLAQHSLKGASITEMSGILNSTTNYILSRMQKGGTFHEALKFAQKAGFAEADPEHDIEGWDSAAKITALANALMQAEITPYDVERKGISDITPGRVNDALRSGNCIKLICKAWHENNKIYTRVRPEEIPISDTFATIGGSGACLKIETDLMSPVLIVQESPTLYDTAFGVLEDILTIQQELNRIDRRIQ